MRTCRVCGLEKEDDLFMLRDSKRKGLCAECKKQYNRVWYLKNKEKHKKRTIDNGKRYRSERTEFLRELKDADCADCGVRYDHFVMQFDHVPERGKKNFTIGAVCSWMPIEKLKEEILKCDVVCANCHAIRTWNRSHNLMERVPAS